MNRHAVVSKPSSSLSSPSLQCTLDPPRPQIYRAALETDNSALQQALADARRQKAQLQEALFAGAARFELVAVRAQSFAQRGSVAGWFTARLPVSCVTVTLKSAAQRKRALLTFPYQHLQTVINRPAEPAGWGAAEGRGSDEGSAGGSARSSSGAGTAAGSGSDEE